MDFSDVPYQPFERPEDEDDFEEISHEAIINQDTRIIRLNNSTAENKRSTETQVPSPSTIPEIDETLLQNYNNLTQTQVSGCYVYLMQQLQDSIYVIQERMRQTRDTNKVQRQVIAITSMHMIKLFENLYSNICTSKKYTKRVVQWNSVKCKTSVLNMQFAQPNFPLSQEFNCWWQVICSTNNGVQRSELQNLTLSYHFIRRMWTANFTYQMQRAVQVESNRIEWHSLNNLE